MLPNLHRMIPTVHPATGRHGVDFFIADPDAPAGVTVVHYNTGRVYACPFPLPATPRRKGRRRVRL